MREHIEKDSVTSTNKYQEDKNEKRNISLIVCRLCLDTDLNKPV